MAQLPYVSAPGSIKKALIAIKSAATPERVSQDFVKTVLKVGGGSGDQLTSFLKKIGFAASDGAPTDTYRSFRNPSHSGKAVADAIRKAYAPLYVRNEFMHKLSDAELKGLIVEETGSEPDSTLVALTFSCIKNLKEFANFSFDDTTSNTVVAMPNIDNGDGNQKSDSFSPKQQLGLNLSYTINLNLPATSDVSVFNAIFKSLKENLLKE